MKYFIQVNLRDDTLESGWHSRPGQGFGRHVDMALPAVKRHHPVSGEEDVYPHPRGFPDVPAVRRQIRSRAVQQPYMPVREDEIA